MLQELFPSRGHLDILGSDGVFVGASDDRALQVPVPLKVLAPTELTDCHGGTLCGLDGT